MGSSESSGINRRDFLIQSGLITGALITGTGCKPNHPPVNRASYTGVSIICDPRDAFTSAPPSQWAAEQLRSTLASRGVAARLVTAGNQPDPNHMLIIAGRIHSAVEPRGTRGYIAEGFELVPTSSAGKRGLFAHSDDTRGFVYSLTELSEMAAFAPDPVDALMRIQPTSEFPRNSIRSVMRMFVSDVEDKGWFNDRDFWRDYLTMLVSQRFNRFNLSLGLGYDAPNGLRDTYFYFAYPFLLSVPGYNVRATNLSDAERDRNLEMLRFISDETAARGLDFQLGLWTHAYKWTRSPQANHVIEGLTDDKQAAYCRDALAILLKECPNISGVTFRIHGESGVAEGSYQFWASVFDGCVRSGRRVRIDMHAKGMDQGTIDAAINTGLPVTISPKYWAEHMGLPYHQAAIRPTELPTRQRGGGLFAQSSGARSFLRYGYGDLLSSDRKFGIFHRMWPGTQRVLLWADPVFAASFSRASSFCGSLGCEIMEPLSFKGRKGSGLPGGRDGYTDLSLRAAGGDFEKYRYTYRLWGRLLYNPDAPAETWQRELQHDYGSAAAPEVEQALAHASRILPLVTAAHDPSAANNNYWPEMYVNMSIVAAGPNAEPYNDTPVPRRFGTVSPLDPQLFYTIDGYADALLQSRPLGKYTPAEVAQWLDSLSATAAQHLDRAKSASANASDPAFRRFAIDVAVQSELGRFFAAKLRSAIRYAIYDRTKDRAALDAAISEYHSARDAWTRIIELTAPVYVADLTYGPGPFQRGNWGDRLAAIDQDIQRMEDLRQHPTTDVSPTTQIKMSDLDAKIVRQALPVQHRPPVQFTRGQAIKIEMSIRSLPKGVEAATLWYRRVNQAELWVSAGMERSGAQFSSAIPAEYTDSPYAMQYYFDISGNLYPGFNDTLSNQPYFVVQAARSGSAR